MTGSLDGPSLKLGRAGKHLDELELVVGAFVKSEVEKFTIEHEGGTRLWIIDEPSPVPPEFGLYVSDCLSNLRSALDYLATQLVKANPENRPDVGLSDVGFPIFDSIEEYVERGLPMIRKMREGVKTAIEAAQPYHRPSPKWKTDRLLLLNRLNNAYKHSDFKLTVLSIEGGGGFNVPDGVANNAGPLEGRTILMAWPNEDPEVEVDWTFTLDVVLAEGPWLDKRVVKTLREIQRTTELTIGEVATAGGLMS